MNERETFREAEGASKKKPAFYPYADACLTTETFRLFPLGLPEGREFLRNIHRPGGCIYFLTREP